MPDIYATQITTFMNDIVNLLNTDTYWKDIIKPRISKKYSRKVVGLGKSTAEAVLVYSDMEQIKPFSLGIGIDQTAAKSWFHTFTGTIEILTNISDVRMEQIASTIINILKRNVTLAGYVLLTPVDVKNRSDETRGNYRMLIDIRADKYAPSV